MMLRLGRLLHRKEGCDTPLRVFKQGRIEADGGRDRVSPEQVAFLEVEMPPFDPTQLRRMAVPAF